MSLLILVSVTLLFALSNISMLFYCKQRLSYVTIETANYAVTLGQSAPNYSSSVTTFASALLAKMGIKYNGGQITPVVTTVAGQTGVSVTITNSFPIIGSAGPSIKLSDSATTTLVGRLPTGN